MAGFDQLAQSDRAGLGLSTACEGRLGWSRSSDASWAAARAELRPLWTTAGLARELAARVELRVPLVQAMRWPLGGPDRGLSLRLVGSFKAWHGAGATPAETQARLTLALE